MPSTATVPSTLFPTDQPQRSPFAYSWSGPPAWLPHTPPPPPPTGWQPQPQLGQSGPAATMGMWGGEGLMGSAPPPSAANLAFASTPEQQQAMRETMQVFDPQQQAQMGAQAFQVNPHPSQQWNPSAAQVRPPLGQELPAPGTAVGGPLSPAAVQASSPPTTAPTINQKVTNNPKMANSVKQQPLPKPGKGS